MDKEKNQLITAVKKSIVFSSLSEETITKLLHQFKQIHLKKNEHLFKQGDPSDHVYLLLEGKMCAFLHTEKTEAVIGYILPGETIGESGCLSDEPRSLSIKAMMPTTLLAIASEVFKIICQQHPLVLYETVKPIIKRSLSALKMISNANQAEKNIFIPAHDDINMNNVRNMLEKNMKKNKKMTFINAEDFFNQSESALQHNNDEDKDLAIFFHKQSELPLLNYFMTHDCTCYVIVDTTHHDKVFANEIKNYLSLLLKNENNKLKLILLHPNNRLFPENTEQWLSQIDFDLHHHVRFDHDNDYARLGRFISNSATALVLGGGGMKGLAHIGVLKALEEKNITIDMIGGTSIGAIAGACYDVTSSFEAFQNTLSKLIASGYRALKFYSLTWPVTSLLSGSAPTTTLHETFQDIRIENMWRPFFCVSANLSEHSEMIHQKGLLWEKLRASASIPGLVPGMVIDGQIHFDGGLLNNLPVDVMRNLIGQKNTIIAVQLPTYKIDERVYAFPPVLPFTQAFLSRFRLANRNYRFPDFIDVFLNSLLMGASYKERQNSMAADILINPQLSNYGTLTEVRKDEQKIIEIGYEEALAVLSNKMDDI